MRTTRTKLTWIGTIIIGISFLPVMGCFDLYEQASDQPQEPPLPSQVTEADAAECLKRYGTGIADVFERAATQFDQHTPSAVIVDEMGDSLKQSRVDSFMPLMQRLNELTGDNSERATQLRKWAKQLRK